MSNLDDKQIASALVIAHIAGRPHTSDELQNLIRTTYATVAGLGAVDVATPEPEQRKPAVSIKASVKPGHVTCMECGYKGKMLKRHLKDAHGMDPDAYRTRWGLAKGHLLTAPDYSERRKELAVKIGLGHKPAVQAKR